MQSNALVVAGRSFVALRKGGRLRSSRQAVFHAVTPGCRMSLCADEPGAGSGWANPPAEEVTCSACLKRLERLGHKLNVDPLLTAQALGTKAEAHSLQQDAG